MKEHVPNIISAARIPMSIALLFFPTMDTAFIVLYIATFITDILDGNIARMTGTCSELGKRLDGIADVLFTAVIVIKIIQWVPVPPWMWVWLIMIAVIRLTALYLSSKDTGLYTTAHSIPDKISGLLVFLSLFIYDWFGIPGLSAVCIFATFSAFTELYIALNHTIPHS